MRRSGLLLVLSLVLAATACGGATPTASDSGSAPEVTTTQKQQNPPDESLRPPKLVLTSSAGSQEAVEGSSCVNSSSGGACADTAYPLRLKQISIVRPGDVITVSLEQAQIVRAENCVAARERDCIGVIKVHPLGCEKLNAYTLSLEPGKATRWKVVLPPGAYELESFVHFESDDGLTSGDVSGAFGLMVDSSRSPEIVPASSISSDRTAC